jgi:hypothetical protein
MLFLAMVCGSSAMFDMCVSLMHDLAAGHIMEVSAIATVSDIA